MFLKKLVGRTDIENALQKLENVTLEESRMTGAEALKAINGVKGMIQGLTAMLQGANVRVKDTGDKVINSTQTVQSSMFAVLIAYMVRQ
jgi:translation initiation factor IF-2